MSDVVRLTATAYEKSLEVVALQQACLASERQVHQLRQERLMAVKQAERLQLQVNGYRAQIALLQSQGKLPAAKTSPTIIATPANNTTGRKTRTSTIEQLAERVYTQAPGTGSK